MIKPREFDRRTNLYSGLAALVLLAGGLTYAVVSKLMSMPTEHPRVYVAYFENSGGLRDGDRVRIQGRSAGKVNNVQVVNHNGNIVTRVEFEITPGTGSKWLTEMEQAGGIPADSKIGVRMPSLMGRPILVITIGDDDANPIGEGGEWLHTASANEKDQLSQWGEDIERGRVQIRQFVDFFEDREQFDALNRNLGAIADALEETDQSMAGLEGRGTQISDAFTQAQAGMAEASEALRLGNKRAGAELPELSRGAADGAAALDDVAEDVGKAMDQVQRLRDSLDDAVSSLEKSKLETLGIELRRLSTRLRAGLELAERDPKQFGDLPNWRKSRPYFQGGKPTGGTSLDDPEPVAPSEKIGVPAGRAIGPQRK